MTTPPNTVNLVRTSASLSNSGEMKDHAPAQTILTSNSETYTTPAGVLWNRVRMVGGCGCGSGNQGGGAGYGGTGGNTTPTGTTVGYDYVVSGINASQGVGQAIIPKKTLSLSNTTTVYLGIRSDQTVASGWALSIVARRVR